LTESIITFCQKTKLPISPVDFQPFFISIIISLLMSPLLGQRPFSWIKAEHFSSSIYLISKIKEELITSMLLGNTLLFFYFGYYVIEDKVVYRLTVKNAPRCAPLYVRQPLGNAYILFLCAYLQRITKQSQMFFLSLQSEIEYERDVCE
jgi:hypothetical protein